MSWESLPLGRGVEVIARDANGVGALSKPAGVLSMPNRAGEERRSLLVAAYDEKAECFVWEGGRLWLLNRLDSATSGVILVADNAAVAAAVKAQFKRREISKGYAALVFGAPRETSALWKDRLAVEKKGGQIRTGGGHVPAESTMKVLRRWTGRDGVPSTALLKLEPHTGRSHQLRVQCARRTLPIVGDQTYGDFPANRAFAKATGSKRLFLHSWETAFTYEWDGKQQTFKASAAMPLEFEAGPGRIGVAKPGQNPENSPSDDSAEDQSTDS